MGMTILYAFLRPFDPVLLFFIIPMPVVVAVGAFVAYDLYRAATHRQGNIGSAGHIGGAIAGTLYYFLKIRGRF
jgi:membrane associated rhomboid family serine protease